MSREAGHLVLVLNKADQASSEKRDEVSAFTGGHRVENDFRANAREIRTCLREVDSAERALRIAHAKQTTAEGAIKDRLQQLARWEAQLRVDP